MRRQQIQCTIDNKNLTLSAHIFEFCPQCHLDIFPKILPAICSEVYDRGGNAILYQIGIPLICPACGSIYLGVYTLPHKTLSVKEIHHLNFLRNTPSRIEPPAVAAEIQRISPDFLTAYSEAHVAEQHELTDLSGMGYRKALELLVKDFLCHLHPDEKQKQKIAANTLSQCISDLDNEHLRIVARRCSQLGNDYAHYQKRYNSQSIEDMKALLRAVIYHIQIYLLSEAAKNDLPKATT